MADIKTLKEFSPMFFDNELKTIRLNLWLDTFKRLITSGQTALVASRFADEALSEFDKRFTDKK